MFEKLKNAVGQILDKITRTELSNEKLDSLLFDFKITLLENDVALSVAEEICEEIKQSFLGTEVDRFENKEGIVKQALKETLYRVLITPHKVDLLDTLATKKRENKPLVAVFIGVNGTGKTTAIAKVANLCLKKGYSVVLAGSDTYRAGSIEQLEGHAKRLSVKVIKHAYGSDAAAVAYDAINYAKNHGVNAVLVDTAGRMQTNRNLIDEMKKIIRVTNPDLVFLVIDALTGNDAVEQGLVFNEAIGINGIILTKLDADAKGGAAISITFSTKKPIIFLGTGQRYEDLIPFNPKFLVEQIIT